MGVGGRRVLLMRSSSDRVAFCCGQLCSSVIAREGLGRVQCFIPLK